MPRAYAVDLRERSLRAGASGLPATEVARLFDVSLSSLARWRQQQRTTGALTPGQSPGRPRSITPTQEPHLVVVAQVTARPDATLAAHGAQWADAHGVSVSPTTMGRTLRTLQRLGVPLKKRR